MVKSFAWTTHCSHCSVVNACGINRVHSFHFFQIIRQNAVNDGFRYPVFYTIILQLARQSFKTAATRAMFSFGFVVLRLVLHSASSVDISLFPTFHSALCLQSTPHPPLTGYAIEILEHVRHGRVTKSFYKHFPRFRSCNSHFTIKFYRGMLFNIFSMVIHKTSTERTIMQNALILSHIDGSNSNLVCR